MAASIVHLGFSIEFFIVIVMGRCVVSIYEANTSKIENHEPKPKEKFELKRCTWKFTQDLTRLFKKLKLIMVTCISFLLEIGFPLLFPVLASFRTDPGRADEVKFIQLCLVSLLFALMQGIQKYIDSRLESIG